MAGLRISKEAKERKFVLMPEGDQILQVTKVEVKPKGKPKVISIEAKNKDGITITNRWDITNETQEAVFWMFYNLGCGLDEDEDGFVDPEAMVGRFVLVKIVHKVGKTLIDEATGEEKPPRTFANFGYIHGNVKGFDAETEDDIEDEADEDEYELD